MLCFILWLIAKMYKNAIIKLTIISKLNAHNYEKN